MRRPAVYVVEGERVVLESEEPGPGPVKVVGQPVMLDAVTSPTPAPVDEISPPRAEVHAARIAAPAGLAGMDYRSEVRGNVRYIWRDGCLVSAYSVDIDRRAPCVQCRELFDDSAEARPHALCPGCRAGAALKAAS